MFFFRSLPILKSEVSRWFRFVSDYIRHNIELCCIFKMFEASGHKHSRNRLVNISTKGNGASSNCEIFVKSHGNCLDMTYRSAEKGTSLTDSMSSLFPRKNSLTVNTIKRVELLLPYKSYEKKQNKQRYMNQLDVKVYERYKIQNARITKKLQKVVKDDVSVVTDLDKKFFKIVNGRPLYHHIPLYKSLNILLNSLLRIRQEIGYINDCILNIEINFRMEKEIYDSSLQRFTQQTNIFDRYIMEDYQKSMNTLQEGKKLNAKLEEKISELQNIADKSFTIKSRLIGLDYKYGLQQKYGRFLYYLSPPIWRSNNRDFARSVEIEAKGFDYGSSNADDSFTVTFEKMRKECFGSFVKPVLYFTYPHDLIDVFNGMEKQQVYHFSRETQLAPHRKTLNEGIQILKEKNATDSAAVRGCITGFENLLLFCEERSHQLKEQFFKILNGCFYKTVGTPEVLKLIVHLEFCFDKVFCEKPMNIDIVTMAKALETTYLDYSKRLDAIQGRSVRSAMKRCIGLDNMKEVKAKCAAKELRLFYRLEKELLRAHNLLPREVNVQSKNNNNLQLKGNRLKSRVTKERQQSLTDAEIEYLTLFTDWTKEENPALYLQSLTPDNMKKNG